MADGDAHRQGRKEREIDPAVVALGHVVDAAEGDPRVGKIARARLHEMQNFVTTIDAWYEQMLTVPPSKIMALMKLGSRIANLLSFAPKRHVKKAKAS